MSATPMTNPKVAAELGEEIYRDRYKDEYERIHPGKFVAIDVLTGNTVVDDTPEGALDRAYAKAPGGMFHLIQVGHAGAFRVSYSTHTPAMDWIL